MKQAEEQKCKSNSEDIAQHCKYRILSAEIPRPQQVVKSTGVQHRPLIKYKQESSSEIGDVTHKPSKKVQGYNRELKRERENERKRENSDFPSSYPPGLG